MQKFMQAVGDGDYKMVKQIAKDRGITVQEVIRQAVDDWLRMREAQKHQ